MRWLMINIPMLFLLNALLGMYGIVWATPTAETGSLIVAAFLVVLLIRDIRQGKI
jgi:hypothetical protein